MGRGVGITVTGLDRALARLEAIEGGLRGTDATLQSIGEVIRRHVQERFASRTDPWGGAWAPLSPTTIAIAQKRGKPTGGAGIAGAFKAELVGKVLHIELGSQVAAAFQNGAPSTFVFGRKRTTRPARPILPLRNGVLDMPEAWKEEIKAAFREALRRTMGAPAGG